jgi:tetratricopeptide (TPR) repeat protein
MANRSEQKVIVKDGGVVHTINQIKRIGIPITLIVAVVVIAIVLVSGYDLRTLIEKKTGEETIGTSLPSIPTAAPDEILFLVADFENKGSSSYDVSNRIYEILAENIGEGRFPGVSVRRLPVVISREEMLSDPMKLGTIARNYNARFIIWGFYDDAGFSPSFNLAEVLPARKIAEGETVSFEFEMIDTQIAQILGLFEDHTTWVGRQERLAEQPTEEKIQAYIREALPKQMTFLSALSLGFMLESPHNIEALDIAIEMGEDINELDFLAKADYWRERLFDAYFERGASAAIDRNDFPQALTDFERAIELNPSNVRVLYNLGYTLYRLGEPHQAIPYFSQAITLDPSHADSYHVRGKVYFALGNLEQAILDFDQAIALKPNSAGIYHDRGWAYYEDDNPQQAIQDFTKAIELDPSYVDAYRNRGVVYVNSGRPEQAIRDFTKAIELGDVLAYRYRGLTYANLGISEKAIEDLERYLELNPNDSEVMTWIEQLKLQKKE